MTAPTTALPWLTTPLVGPRVVVRALVSTDLPGMLAVNGDEATTRFLPYAAWQSMDDAEGWLRRISALQHEGGLRQYTLVGRADGVVIGSAGLFRFEPASRRVELGYVLGRAFHGQGLAREALGLLLDHAFAPAPTGMGLRRVEAEVVPDNAPSVRLLERLGFTREGHARERWVSRGVARDVLQFGLLDRDWAGRPGPAPAPVSAKARPAPIPSAASADDDLPPWDL